jgi:hypothetical protein
MSQQLISQLVKQTCDACGASKEYELSTVTEETLKSMQEWYTVSRQVIIDGQLQKIGGQACCLACVPAAAVKLALPKQDSVEGADDHIDLASLQVGTPAVN